MVMGEDKRDMNVYLQAFNAIHNCLCRPTSDPCLYSSTKISVVETVTGKVTYQRLQHEGEGEEWEERAQVGVRSSRSSFRLRRVSVRKRFRCRFRVPSLRRLAARRGRLVSAIRDSCGKVVRRLKESRAHFGDLFGGNYLFLQVSPAPLKKSF